MAHLHARRLGYFPGEYMTPFTDYYEILQLNPHADQDTVERVYRLLAKKYHPDNTQTGDVEKFRNLTDAFRVLSDPVQRAAYDATYDGERSQRLQVFYGGADQHEPQDDRLVQQGILSLLYTARRRDASNPGVGIYELERLLSAPGEHLEFHLWYLREKGWIQRTENGQFAITVDGVDEAMQNSRPQTQNPLLTAGPTEGDNSE
jgi:curved DNA-binding protein